MESLSWVEERTGAIRLRVRAQPRASRTEITGPLGDELKVRVAAPPVGGEANEELRRYLAKRLGVAPSRVTLVSGSSSRSKVFEVIGVDRHAARRLVP